MTIQRPCPVCETPASITAEGLAPRMVECRICGTFSVTVGCVRDETIITDGANLTKLRCILAERNLKGLKNLTIVASPHESVDERVLMTVEQLVSEFPRNPTECFDRALLNLARSISFPSNIIPRTVLPDSFLFSPEGQED